MSHFIVAVFSKDGNYSKLLAPYNEVNEDYFAPEIIYNSEKELTEGFEKWKVENPEMAHLYLEAEMWAEDWSGCQRFKDGSYGYFHNPNSKWDWYDDNGRWIDEYVSPHKNHKNQIKDYINLLEEPYAFVTADGEWIEPGEMGWWGVSTATPETMSEFATKWFDYVTDPKNRDLYVSWLNCHI